MLRDLEPLATSAGTYAFVVLLGLLWGSFANVCIYRWPPSAEFPKGRSVVAPGSHCFACKTPIRWYDNVPLASWLWLRGKCRACKAQFSARYLIVEAVTGALFGVAWFATVELGVLTESFDLRIARFAVYAAFAFVMVVIAFIDLDHKLILDKVTYPSMVVFYALGLALGRSWHHGLVGAAIGYGLPWAIGEVYWIVSGREGLGLGDSTMLAVVGALLGAHGVVATLFGGALVGAMVGVVTLFRGGDGDGPPRSWASMILALVAVASVVAASVGALAGNIPLGLAGSVCALVALVISRRLEPALPDEEPHEGEPEAPATVGGAELGARVLAIVGAGGVLLGVTATLLGWPVGAVAGGVAGLGLLLVAGRLHVPPPDAGEADDAGDASLLRTQIPFGPFLALAALVYLFAEPWIVVNFRLPGG